MNEKNQGVTWNQARALFVRHAERFMNATQFEVASAIADEAARDIEALSPSEQPEPVAWRKALSDIDGHFTYSNVGEDGDGWQPLYAQTSKQTGGGGVDLVEDEEWSESPLANAIYDHLQSQFCLHPEEAAEEAGAILQILRNAGPDAILAALSTNEVG